MSTGVTDALVEILRRQQASGKRAGFLDPDVEAAFFNPRPKTPSLESRGPQTPPRVFERPAPAPSASPRPADRVSPPDGSPAGPQAIGASMPSAGGPIAGLGWDDLAARVGQCRLCALCETRTQTVLEDGSRSADLMFIGEGPGRDEDQQGVPFVGAAGQLLTRMITAMQFSRSDVYIDNIVKCRPPHNRNPEPHEGATCLPYLQRQIELVAPKVIVLLGAVPLLFLLGEKGIQRLRGNWREYHGIPVMPTFHPAFLIRAPERKGEAWSDLQQVMLRLGKDPQNTVRAGR